MHAVTDPRRDMAVSNNIKEILVYFLVENVFVVFLTIFQSSSNEGSFGVFAAGLIAICFFSLFNGIVFGLASIPDIRKLERKGARKEKKKKIGNPKDPACEEDKTNTNSSPAVQIPLAEHEAIILNEMRTKYEEDTKIAIDLCKKELKEEEIRNESKYHEELPFIFHADKFETPTIQIPLAEHRSLINEMKIKCEKDIKRATDKCKKEFKEKAKEKKNKFYEEKTKWENERYAFVHELGRLQHFENIVLSYTPACNKTYVTNPYATDPSTTYPYATDPYTTYPYATYPYHTYSYGTSYATNQTGTNPYATNRNATTENATNKNDTEQNGTDQNGTSVATPNGTTSNSSVATPNSTTPNSYGTLNGSYGTNPNGTNQSDTTWRDVLIGGIKLSVPNLNDCVGKTMPVPNLATTLANAPIEEQRKILGEHLYPLVDKIEHEHVTGMLLEMDQTEALYLIESTDALKVKVAEAMGVLEIVKTTSTRKVTKIYAD